jgi:hypothetical protein
MSRGKSQGTAYLFAEAPPGATRCNANSVRVGQEHLTFAARDLRYLPWGRAHVGLGRKCRARDQSHPVSG